MKRIFLGCLFLLSLFGCTHRKVVRPAGREQWPFDEHVFRGTCALAEALAKDDRTAWRSTDSIMAEKPIRLDSLDKTWFVDARDDTRYVFYGRYSEEDDTYYPKYAFIAGGSGEVKRIPPVADERARRVARAICTGTTFFESLVDSMRLHVDYNHYIRKNGDGSYAVWFFPAGYGNYCAHGFDVYLTVDSTGSTVTGHTIVGKFLRYFEIDKKHRTVELDNTYDATPSLGNVFFTIMNRERFDRIVIYNSRSTSSMVYSPEKQEWEWVHKGKESGVRSQESE